MRALLIGFIGVALFGGAAHAAECPLERTVYEARDTGERPYGAEVARPDLAGARFSVVRSVGKARVIKEEGFSEPTKTARLSLLVSGEQGRFVIERQFASHSSPSVTARSWPEASAEKRSDQSRAGAAKAGTFFAKSPEISVLDGPLSGLMMKPVACRGVKQNNAQLEP